MTTARARRVLICGTRGFQDRALVESVVAKLVKSCHKGDYLLVIVHGACPTGADAFANEAGLRAVRDGDNVVVEPHPADWSKGQSAGPRRNLHMAELGADICFAFWDGHSRGTLNMIQEAVRHRIPVFIPTMLPGNIIDAICQSLGLP